MEYAEGGELFDYIIKKDHLSEEEARNIFHQIIDVIDYMNHIGICHRDLKPENILFDSSHKKIKIIDFGLSNLYYTNDNDENYDEDLDFDYLETPCGSPGYAPPEMILGYSYDGLKTDVWSSGIILYAMLCGSFPFDDDSEQILYSKIIKGIFEFPDDIILSDESKNLIKKILIVNPSYRATIEDIKNDPWFKKDYKPTYGIFFFPLKEIPVDNLIISEMEKKGYKKEEIINNIKNNKHNEITTFYYLLVKQFSKNGIETVNDLISPCFNNYVLQHYEKLKNIDNYKILLNLKYNFEKIRIEEVEKMKKELQNKINREKEIINEIQKEKENTLKKEKIKDNKNEIKTNKTLEITNPKDEGNIPKNISNSSHKKEENSRNFNYSHVNKIKENQIKKFRNKNIGALHKNKKFKKSYKVKEQKESCQNNYKKLKINSYIIEKTSRSQNKKELKTSANIKRDGNFNESFPYPDNDISSTLAVSSKRERNYINQGINSSRLNTDRINYEKYFPNKQNTKPAIKKGNIPLYQNFTLNCNENKNHNLKTKYKTNQGFINKVVKNSKTSAFNVYYLNNTLKYSNNNPNNSIKNIKTKNFGVKNVSVQKEKGNMSYRQLQRDKILFEQNLSRILTVSEGKSSSNSKAKAKLLINTPFNTSSRNKYYKNLKKIKNKEQILENNYCYKKIKKYHIENREKREKKRQEIKLNTNKSNDNNINLSININLNLNQNKYLKEKERSTVGEQYKHKNFVKSLKGIKLDLKKINNNYQTYNKNSMTNSERIKDNIFKINQELMMNKKNNYVNTTKSLLNYQNKDYKFKKIDETMYKNLEIKQKSFVNQNHKTNRFTSSLSKLLPFLKDINCLKPKSLKKGSPHINLNHNNNYTNTNITKKSMNLNNNSNSIIINKTNININNITNNRYKTNSKIEQIKQSQNLLNSKNMKNFSNNSYITEIPNINFTLLNQDKNNSKNSKKSPKNVKLKPLNLKGILNDRKSSYVYKSLTMRGEQSKNKILISMKDELSKSSHNKNKVKKEEKSCGTHIINKISPTENISNEAVFGISPFKIRDILMSQLPKSGIYIKQKSTKNNYFVFLCYKGSLIMIIELLQIKGNNYIFVNIKYFSGNQNEFIMIRKQILLIINRFKNIANL